MYNGRAHTHTHKHTRTNDESEVATIIARSILMCPPYVYAFSSPSRTVDGERVDVKVEFLNTGD